MQCYESELGLEVVGVCGGQELSAHVNNIGAKPSALVLGHDKDVAEPDPRRKVSHHSGEANLCPAAVVCAQ